MYKFKRTGKDVNIMDYSKIKISLASPETIRAWSSGEVTKPGAQPISNVPLTLLDAFKTFEKGQPTAERRAIILDAVEDLDDARKAWIAARVAELLAAKDIDAPDFAM